MASYPYRLMTPGPVQVPNEVLEELARPMIHHRTPEFEKILTSALTQLKQVFQTEQAAFILPSVGSGAMESAIVNTLSAGDTVLAICSGKFGERWRDIAKTYGMKVLSVEVEWGQAADVSKVREILEQNSDIRAILCQACETSTAVVHPIREIAALVRERPQTIFMVDAITALGVIELPMDEWGLDVVVGGSQKSFMLPAGLSFISFSKKAWSFVEKASSPRYYWDIREELKANKNRQTRFSSPVPLIRALDAGLRVMLRDGLSANIKKFDRLARGLRAGGEAMGLRVYAKVPSPSVTAFLVPEGMNSEKLRDHLESRYNITVMGGQDQLKGRIIRIGTLGWVDETDILETLKALARSMSDLGFSTSSEAAVTACQKVFSVK